MRKLMILGLMLALFSVSASAQTWEFDKAHSEVGFEVSHMVISDVSGQFTDFDGKITNFDGKDFTKAGVEVTIQAASIDTRNEKRDSHLRSGDFLLVDSFPTITFVSTSVTQPQDKEFKIVGDLTIRGVSRQVTLNATLNGIIEDPYGNTRAGFSAETEISRQEYNVQFNAMLETGGLVVGDEVKIELQVEAIREK